MKTPLVLRYFIWSMLIFAVSMALLSFRALRPLELRANEFTFSSRFYIEMDTRPGKQMDVPVMVVPFYEQISQELFLKSVTEITRNLKKAGAKVVVVPLVGNLRPSPTNMGSIRELIRDSIVIFGVSEGVNIFMDGPEPSPDNKKNWWIHHPLYQRVQMPWGAMTEYTRSFSRLTRFIPMGMRDYDSGALVPDVIVLALKRYFDIPDYADLPASPSRLQIGPFAVPIERDGLSYCRIHFTNRRMVEMYASLNPVSYSLTFFPAYATRANDTAAIHAAWNAHKGKIVILDWVGSGSFRYPSQGWAYANIVSSFFERSFVKVHNEWNVLLVTTLVILLSVVSYTVRNGIMVFLSLALAVAAVLISAWLFRSHNVLFEPVYVIVPILLCGVVLPIAKIAGEKRIAEERARSLEEENQRLHDLQRSGPPENRF